MSRDVPTAMVDTVAVAMYAVSAVDGLEPDQRPVGWGNLPTDIQDAWRGRARTAIGAVMGYLTTSGEHYALAVAALESLAPHRHSGVHETLIFAQTHALLAVVQMGHGPRTPARDAWLTGPPVISKRGNPS